MTDSTDLNAIALFVQVVDATSFSAASRQNGIPVSTISRRINELETALGVRLLERSTRHLRVTDIGMVLYEYAKRSVEEMQAGLFAIENRQQELSGTLRLSVPPSFLPWQGVLQSFRLRYPKVNIRLYITERRLDLIEDGIDVALRIGQIEDDNVIARKLANYRHQLVASPDLFKRYGKPTQPRDILDLPCACWNNRKTPTTWKLGKTLLTISPFLQVNDFLHLRSLALSGECITELPPFLAATPIKSGTLMEVLPQHPLPDVGLYLLYPSRKNLPQLVNTYINYCLTELTENQFLY